MSSESYDGNSDRQKIRHLPHVGEGPTILTRQTALAAFFILKSQNPNLYHQLHDQLKDAQQAMSHQLAEFRNENGRYEITEAGLRGIVAQNIILGSVKAALAIGATLEEISLLEGEQGDITNRHSEDE